MLPIRGVLYTLTSNTVLLLLAAVAAVALFVLYALMPETKTKIAVHA